MPNSHIADIRWLTSSEGGSFLSSKLRTKDAAVAIGALRKKLSPSRARIIVEQWELQRRASVKFTNADDLFFTRKSLEQATGSVIGDWKARRFTKCNQVADLCCGIGGDLLSLAEVATVIGAELDEPLKLLCEANVATRALSASVECKDATTFALESVDAWHIDPDRRANTNRSTRAEAFEPDSIALQEMLKKNENASMKLAPATPIEPWMECAELNWVGHQRSCQQLIAWFAGLAKFPGCRSATILKGDGERNCGRTR